jgi:hypothetical protein|tara:strand:- start:484 stop:726 length:243 start_codon:yes stop_codon:yes gene_type:complete
MAMDGRTFKAWAATIDDDNQVAINDDCQALVELLPDGTLTESFCEVGPIPQPETCDACGTPFTDKDIDGGRCIACGSMIC